MYHKFKQYPNSLRKHRRNVGLRQEEVAKALGLNTPERISKWENGHSIPALWSLFRLAALYRVPPHELYDELYMRASVSAAETSSADTQTGECTPRHDTSNPLA
jgi:transcriptional regulator with XRE-family HTH domain